MLAQIVLIQQFLLHRGDLGVQHCRVECHECKFFQNHCVMYCIVRVSNFITVLGIIILPIV